MDRKTALSTAGALTMTASAAVAALFMTVGTTSADPGAEAPDVVTEYQVVAVDDIGLDAAGGTTVREIEYVQAAPAVTDFAMDASDQYEDHDEYEDDDRYEYDEYDDDEHDEHEDDDDD